MYWYYGGDDINTRAKIIKPIINLISQDEEFRIIDDKIINGVYYDTYMISNYGRVYSKWSNKILKPGMNCSGYQFVEISTCYGPKPVSIHRMVLLTFNYIPGCENLEVNHIDGNKLNNNLSNLEWVTQSENIKHAYNIGLHQKGSASSLSKINEETAKMICELLSTNLYTNEDIVNIVGNNATIDIVADIRNGQSWTDISKDYTFFRRPGSLFGKDEISKICKYFEDNPKPYYLNTNDYCRQALLAIGHDNSDRYVDSVRKIYGKKYYTYISKNYKF